MITASTMAFIAFTLFAVPTSVVSVFFLAISE